MAGQLFLSNIKCNWSLMQKSNLLNSFFFVRIKTHGWSVFNYNTAYEKYPISFL